VTAGDAVCARLVRPASSAPALTVGLLHGMQETWEVWDRLAPLLPANAEVHALGLPWDGRQGHAWTREREPRDWAELALARLPEGPVALVAHSFGANALLEHLVARGGERVAALVLLSPFYRPGDEGVDWAVISYYLNDFHRILEEGLRVRMGPGVDAAILAGMGVKLRDRVGPLGWLRFFELFARTPALDASRLAMPCLVIGGERDFASFPGDCEALGRALPDARVEILAGVGHFAMIESPERVAASIGRFFRGEPPPGAGGRCAQPGRIPREHAHGHPDPTR
jgi:pimeloyl-ACP methyl ester carboxylesterase